MNQVSRWITSLTLLAVLLPHNSSVDERSSTVGFHGEGKGRRGEGRGGKSGNSGEGRGGGERRGAFHLLYQAGYFSSSFLMVTPGSTQTEKWDGVLLH